LNVILGKPTTIEEVNAAMKAASNESFGYTEDELVSTDIIGMNFGSLFDATQTKVIGTGDKQLVKAVSWYDNEMSYVSQLVRTVKHFAGLMQK
jgi:glyceraldehyde 3-phosphate dehydrogenase